MWKDEEGAWLTSLNWVYIWMKECAHKNLIFVDWLNTECNKWNKNWRFSWRDIHTVITNQHKSIIIRTHTNRDSQAFPDILRVMTMKLKPTTARWGREQRWRLGEKINNIRQTWLCLIHRIQKEAVHQFSSLPKCQRNLRARSEKHYWKQRPLLMLFNRVLRTHRNALKFPFVSQVQCEVSG